MSKTKLVENEIEEKEIESKLRLIEDSGYTGSTSMPSFYSKNGFEIITKSITTKKKNKEENIKDGIFNYEDSISFLKSLYQNYLSLNEYQQKYPDYKYFHNIVFSQPTDFLLDYQKLSFEIIEIENVKAVNYIIVNFPKSEYYSAIAINILVFVAKRLFYNVNHSIVRDLNHKLRKDVDYDISHFDSKVTEACEYANLQVIELLRSDEIFDYQKYVILRALFISHDTPNISLKNYDIKKLIYHDLTLQDLNIDYILGGFNPDLPFKKLIINEIQRLNNSTDHYALKSVTEHLIK